MNKNEYVYLDLLRHIRDNGKDQMDRTGVGTRRIFGTQSRYDLREGFPLLTTKKIDIKSVASELLWFIEGSGDERRLAEIRYGKPRSELTGKKTIWTANAEAEYWKPKAEFKGDLGRVYGIQWRNWRTPVVSYEQSDFHRFQEVSVRKVDQLSNLIEGLKRDPYGRRHILTAWNPGELDQMALPPCHVLSQFFVEDGVLSCHLFQRSCDLLLGAPYNLASYALFTHMIAAVCGLEVGEFLHTITDAHIYLNHLEQVDEQLSRRPSDAPRLVMTPRASIDDYVMEDFALEGYDPQPAIKAPMAV